MIYRDFGNTGIKVSNLGFGCMRFPVIDNDFAKINEAPSIEMIRKGIDSGINYLDTAYGYHNGASEVLLGKALADGYRDKVYLATKLPSYLVKTREDMDRFLDEQLARLNTDHIDFYLLHVLNRIFWPNILKLGVLEFLEKAVASGKIRYAGFSFHDDLSVFKEITDAYPWTFCQIQFNYMDETFQAGLEGLHYAADKGMAVVVMEPLRGGSLTRTVPEDIQKIWDASPVKRTPAEWGLRYVWNYPEVSVVLSGMGTMSQLEENLKVADEAVPNSLTPDEISRIGKVRDLYRSKIKVDCTGCQYCMPCPNGVNIPWNFHYYNNLHMYSDPQEVVPKYMIFVPEDMRSNKCIECGECEPSCPQTIPIREKLKEVSAAFKLQ